VKRSIQTSGVVGTASTGATAVALAKAGAPWWGVLLGVVLMVLVTLRLSQIERQVSLIELRMTLRMVERLMELRYPGSFKGPCNVELNGSAEPAGPEPEPLKPRRWVGRRPPST